MFVLGIFRMILKLNCTQTVACIQNALKKGIQFIRYMMGGYHHKVPWLLLPLILHLWEPNCDMLIGARNRHV